MSMIHVVPAKVYKQPAVRGCLGNRVRDEASTTVTGGEDEEGETAREENVGDKATKAQKRTRLEVRMKG